MRTARLVWIVSAVLIGASGFLRADDQSGTGELPAAADRPIEFPKGAVLTFHLKQMHGGSCWPDDQFDS